MQTFDQALLAHFQMGRVAMEDALRVASSPHDFKLLVAADGRTATSMDDLLGKDRDAPAAENNGQLGEQQRTRDRQQMNTASPSNRTAADSNGTAAGSNGHSSTPSPSTRRPATASSSSPPPGM